MGVELLPADAIPCPCCLRDDALAAADSTCALCGKTVAADYGRLYRSVGLTALQVFGWSGHGKSTLLGALMLVLSRMSLVWPSYFYRPLTEPTQRKLREINTYVKTGRLPAPTTPDEGTALLLLKGTRPWGDRLVAFRDGPGDVFDALDVEICRLPLLRETIALLALSPSDLLAVAAGRSMEMLMSSFLRLLDEGSHAARLQRAAVVVLTKGDSIPNLPGSVRTYLKQDGPWSLLVHDAGGERGVPADSTTAPAPGSDAYRDRMATVGDTLRAWIEEEPAGRNLVRMADDAGIALRFSAISATGSQADESGFLPSPWHPRRVIDPFLWALELASRASLDSEPTSRRRGVFLQ